jgi:chitobiase/beta-hexosaminidase-like protein
MRISTTNRLLSVACAAAFAGCFSDGRTIVETTSSTEDTAAAAPGAVPAGASELSQQGMEGARSGDTSGPSALGPSGTSQSADSSGSAADDAADPAGECWQLPVADRARLLPPASNPAAVVGGTIMGSNTSAMNDFVELASIDSEPAPGQWVELRWTSATPYRYVKYYAPPGSFGALVELELYRGDERLSGAGFGTAPAPEQGGFATALDGRTNTSFQGALADDNYIGLDLAAEHQAAPPTFEPQPGRYGAAQSVSLSGDPGALVLYTTDGSDPRANGTLYGGPIAIGDGSTLLRAVASRACTFDSEVTQALYQVGSDVGSALSSMHIGNSLTDTIVETLPALAQSGGITLDFNRYTIPGAGTWLYEDSPSGGFGVANVQSTLKSRAFDHLSLQPFPNQPCQPTASADGDDSDAGYINQAWADAKANNPAVQLWIYQQWPSPQAFSNCMSGGGWTRGDWQPPAPATWEDAVRNELSYHEAVRAELVRLNPNDPPPFIVPGGNALAALKGAIEAGSVPGMTSFFPEIFAANGTDLHVSPKGAYLITAVFYASMFQSEPPASALEAQAGLSAEQAAAFRRIAWQTVTSYELSGVPR